MEPFLTVLTVYNPTIPHATDKISLEPVVAFPLSALYDYFMRFRKNPQRKAETMAKHKARKMTKAERENWEAFHADPSKPSIFKIRDASDLIMLPVMLPLLLIWSAPLIVFTVAMGFFTVLGKIGSIFRR